MTLPDFIVQWYKDHPWDWAAKPTPPMPVMELSDVWAGGVAEGRRQAEAEAEALKARYVGNRPDCGHLKQFTYGVIDSPLTEWCMACELAAREGKPPPSGRRYATITSVTPDPNDSLGGVWVKLTDADGKEYEAFWGALNLELELLKRKLEARGADPADIDALEQGAAEIAQED